jgi:hypothetical protein
MFDPLPERWSAPMPPRLHDPAVRDSIRARVQKLSPDANRAWGKMTVDQMLWHCSEALEGALGKVEHRQMKLPLPAPIIKFMVLSLPWMKGAPTHPDFVAGERHDFNAQKARTLSLIDEFCAKRIDATDWGLAGFGKLTGEEHSRLHAKHLDHHLKQFSA